MSTVSGNTENVLEFEIPSGNLELLLLEIFVY